MKNECCKKITGVFRQLFKTQTEQFIIKRAVLLYVFLAAVCIAFFSNRWALAAGLGIGALVCILRLRASRILLERLVYPDSKDAADDIGIAAPGNSGFKAALKSILSMLPAGIILVLSAIIDKWLFAGAAAGILIVPAIITVNGLTEGLRITNNGFGNK